MPRCDRGGSGCDREVRNRRRGDPRLQFRVIGRPSTDLIEPVGPGRSVRTFLYAPTWKVMIQRRTTRRRDIAVPWIQWLLEHRPEVRCWSSHTR